MRKEPGALRGRRDDGLTGQRESAPSCPKAGGGGILLSCCPEVLSSNRQDAGEAPPISSATRRQDETTTGRKVAPRSPKERGAGEESPARRSGPTGTRRAEVGSRREVWFIVAGSCFAHCPPGGRKRGSPLSRFTRGPGKPDQETRKRVCAYTHPQRRRPDREIFQVSRDRRSCSDAKCQRREVSRSRHLVSTPFRVKAFFSCPAFPGTGGTAGPFLPF